MTKKKKSRAKNQKLARRELPPKTALARVTPRDLEPRERASVLAAIDGSLDQKKQRVMHGLLGAFQAAGNLLAPFFTVTSSFADYGGTPGQGIFGEGGVDMRDVNPRTPDSDTLVEVLCSAAAYLAHTKGIPKADLLYNFKKWAEDQGYEPDA